MNDTQLPYTSDSVKLTDWKNEPTLQTLKGDLTAAKPSHDEQMTNITRWNDLLRVQGKAKPTTVKGHSSIQPKLIRRQTEWRYSALSEPFLSSSKLFKVTPVTFEDDSAAKQNDLVLNWQFRTKLNKVKLIDDFVRSTVDDGTCIIQVGWSRYTKSVKQTVPVYEHYELMDEVSLQQFQQILEVKVSDPRMYDEKTDPAIKAAVDYYEETGQVTEAVQTGEEGVSVEVVVENRPVVDILDLNNVYIDPSCNGDIDKALFVIVSYETNKSQLEKEPKKYKNLDKVNWEGNTPLAQPDHISPTPDTFNFNDRSRKKVVAYDYYGFFDTDGSGQLTPIVATWIGDTLVRMEVSPYPDEKLPFVLVTYLPIKRGLYGEPDAELLEDNQKILGAVTRGMIDILGRSANGQQGFAKGMLDPLNRRRFDNGQDYEFNPNVSPAAGLIEHKYPEIPNSAMLMLQLQNQDAEALTGVKSFSGGLSGQGYGDVAAGVRGMLDAASKREMGILRRLAKGMSEIGSKIIAMNAEFLSEEEVVRVTNEEFVTVKREDLKGNFDLEVDISTVEIDNEKAQDLGFMLQTIGPNMDPSFSSLILAEIADLKRMPALAEKIRAYKPQPDPAQEQMKQLAIQKAQLENAELESKIALNNAKAQEALVAKDKNALDLAEQGQGTKHARDLERLQAQSQGNSNLQVTKALTTPRKPGEGEPDIAAAIGFNQITDKMNNAPNSVNPYQDVLTEPEPQLNFTENQLPVGPL
jgi:hypothetical protein